MENANKTHGNGIIDPENFSPFPKNPTIAKFFKELLHPIYPDKPTSPNQKYYSKKDKF